MVPIDMIYLWLQRLSAPTERQLIYINDDYLCASHNRHMLGLSKGSAEANNHSRNGQQALYHRDKSPVEGLELEVSTLMVPAL